jgi:hypothetical protein
MFQHVISLNLPNLSSANESPPSRCRSDPRYFPSKKKERPNCLSITGFMNDESSKTHHVPRSKVIARAAKQEAPDKLAVCLGLAFLFHFVPYLYLDLTFCMYIYQHSPSLFQSFISALCIDVRFPCCIVEF